MTWESKEDYQELKWRIYTILLCTSHHFESGRRERDGSVWGKKKRNKLWDVWESDYKKNLQESNGKKIKNGGKVEEKKKIIWSQ